MLKNKLQISLSVHETLRFEWESSSDVKIWPNYYTFKDTRSRECLIKKRASVVRFESNLLSWPFMDRFSKFQFLVDPKAIPNLWYFSQRILKSLNLKEIVLLTCRD